MKVEVIEPPLREFQITLDEKEAVLLHWLLAKTAGSDVEGHPNKVLSELYRKLGIFITGAPAARDRFWLGYHLYRNLDISFVRS